MKLRKIARIIFITAIAILAITTLAALLDGGYHIAGGAIVGIAIASAITSLLPFFISMHLFKKYESNPGERSKFKAWGIAIYIFCFPVKTWIIFSNILLLINGGDGWAFG
jgi:hypothetical protein